MRKDYLIRNMEKNDLDDVVQIHIRAFPDFFITSLGKGFINELYKDFLIDKYSICKVVEKDNLIKGFVVGTIKPVLSFRKMFFQKGLILLIHSLKVLFVNPGLLLRKLLYAIKYRGETPRGFKNPSLLSSIGINPDIKTKGVGSMLINDFCIEAFSRNADVVYLTTDRDGNDGVNKFYKKNGFHLESIIEQPHKRTLNRYIILPHEKSF